MKQKNFFNISKIELYEVFLLYFVISSSSYFLLYFLRKLIRHIFRIYVNNEIWIKYSLNFLSTYEYSLKFTNDIPHGRLI